MSKTLIIILVIGAALLLAGGVAWAKHRHCQMNAPERMVEYLSGELELNQAQKEKLILLGQSAKSLRGQWSERREQTRNDILGLLETPSLNRDKATQLLQQRQQVWSQWGGELLDRFADFSDSLSEEQRAKLRTLIEAKMSWRPHRAAWSH